MKYKGVYYYSDELNDDFAGTNIKRKKLPADYEYNNNGILPKLRRLFLYHAIVKPLALLHNRRVKIVGREKMKGYKNRGIFLYGNHTSRFADAINPTCLAFPHSADVVVNADAMSIKGLRRVLKSIGALPIPEGFHAMSRFNSAIERSIEKGHCVAIYPEAHIWRYYTKIRPFPPTSFAYPVKLNSPVFAYTMTYHRRKRSARPKRIVYVDGPFYPDMSIPRKEAVKKLRNEVHAAMCERAKLNTCEYFKYIYRSQKGEKAN